MVQVGMAGDPHQLAADFFRGQDEIDAAGSDGAARHARMLGRLLLLGERNAAAALIASSPSVPSVPRRQHHADRPIPLIVGQRTQK